MITTLPQGEKRVTLPCLDWTGYQQILQALGETRSARLTYDRGLLEITMPLESHEVAAQLIGLFIRILVAEWGWEMKSMGSTTLQRPDLDRSPEPDQAFYIQNQSQVAGRTVDLTRDPPPDLVVEIDITHTDIDKLRLYAELGIPEFWRYNGQVWRIYQRQGNAYQEVDNSPTFPNVPKQKLDDFLEQAQQGEVAAERSLRAWVREHLST